MVVLDTDITRPSINELEDLFTKKYGAADRLDWGPGLRRRFRYFSPDDWYEALVSKLVNRETNWLEIGCGRDIFPSNAKLASELSDECNLLVGVDPDPNVNQNPFLHKRVNLPIEDYEPGEPFDLITLRMVAEHIVDPDSAIGSIARCASPGARIVIYTVNKYSPAPVITSLTPFRARHAIKKLLWSTEEKDTFPTAFRLNTRREIRKFMSQHGFTEEIFLRLDDCRSFARWRVLLFLELMIRTALHSIGVLYPEYCLLGVYRKQ